MPSDALALLPLSLLPWSIFGSTEFLSPESMSVWEDGLPPDAPLGAGGAFSVVPPLLAWGSFSANAETGRVKTAMMPDVTAIAPAIAHKVGFDMAVCPLACQVGGKVLSCVAKLQGVCAN